MLFNSHLFLFAFLPLSLLIYFLSKKAMGHKASILSLCLLSLVFYGWDNPKYLILILASISLNFFIGIHLNKSKNPKFLFWIGILLNLSFLGFFKYYDFFIGNLNVVLNEDFPLLHIALPLGISFYTIQQIGYLVDCYQGENAEKDFQSYSIFVLFFPQLISGPIAHAGDILPQFKDSSNDRIKLENFNLGLYIFSLGLFKKVIIADSLSLWVSSVFNTNATPGFTDAWIGSLSYTFQIYYDFSGYSEMALGLAKLFNINIHWNFQSPYKAKNIIDFWKRWHLTLTNFITTYVFTPFIMSFKKFNFQKMLLGVTLSMLVSGLWHGANWTFIVWGALHAAGLIVNHIWKKKKLKMNGILGTVLTFLFLNFSFVIFRAKDIEQAWIFFKSMMGIYGVHWQKPISENINYLIVCFILTFAFPSVRDLSEKFKSNLATCLITAIALIISIMNLTKESGFIYFNF